MSGRVFYIIIIILVLVSVCLVTILTMPQIMFFIYKKSSLSSQTCAALWLVLLSPSAWGSSGSFVPWIILLGWISCCGYSKKRPCLIRSYSLWTRFLFAECEVKCFGRRHFNKCRLSKKERILVNWQHTITKVDFICLYKSYKYLCRGAGDE